MGVHEAQRMALLIAIMCQPAGTRRTTSEQQAPPAPRQAVRSKPTPWGSRRSNLGRTHSRIPMIILHTACPSRVTRIFYVSRQRLSGQGRAALAAAPEAVLAAAAALCERDALGLKQLVVEAAADPQLGLPAAKAQLGLAKQGMVCLGCTYIVSLHSHAHHT